MIYCYDLLVSHVGSWQQLIKKKWTYTEASARQIAKRAERKSLSRSRSVSTERSSDTSFSSFWESSDCDVSLCGYSSQSGSELISANSSSSVQSVDKKENEESSDEEVYVKRKRIYHSDSDDSDEPSQSVLRCRPPRSRGGTARERGRVGRGKTRGSKKSRGGGSGRQSGGRVCSEQKYPHSVPKEAISIETEDKKFTNPPPFHPIREVGPHIPDGCETPLDHFELFFDAHVINRIIRSTTSYAEH